MKDFNFMTLLIGVGIGYLLGQHGGITGFAAQQPQGLNGLGRGAPGGPIVVGNDTCTYIGANVWCCRNRFTGSLQCFNGVAPY